MRRGQITEIFISGIIIAALFSCNENCVGFMIHSSHDIDIYLSIEDIMGKSPSSTLLSGNAALLCECIDVKHFLVYKIKTIDGYFYIHTDDVIIENVNNGIGQISKIEYCFR